MTLWKRFRRDQNGQTAVLFGIMFLPALAAVGCGLDYSRAATVRTALQGAADAAALATARDLAAGTEAQMASYGRRVLEANFRRNDATLGNVQVQRNDRSVRIVAQASVKTTIMSVFHFDTMPVSVAGEAAWGRNRIELALVLDNTLSMASAGKMPALKAAARDLLTELEKVAYDKDAVKVSIVPFNTQVNIGTAFRGASWLTYDADLPRELRTSRSAWSGCVVDREQPYDTQDGGSGTRPAYPAARCEENLARLRPLTSDFAALRRTINDMQPVGYTNITLGAAWGLATLSKDEPLGEAQPFGTARLEKIMIVLTDGDNTRNLFTTNPGAIDARTRLACKEIKDKKIRLYTIRVIEGNRQLLRECASEEGMYHEVRNASELAPVFRRIAAEITGIRLTH